VVLFFENSREWLGRVTGDVYAGLFRAERRSGTVSQNRAGVKITRQPISEAAKLIHETQQRIHFD
jgi:hypothetical protein